jgi:hypothetical protein
MQRRLAEIPTEDWNDVQVDITPRIYPARAAGYRLPITPARLIF